MQVAIAGMEDVSDRERILFCDLVDMSQSFWHSRPGDDAVLDVIRRRDSTDGAEGVLPASPEQVPLALIARAPHFASTFAQADLANRLRMFLHSFLHTL